MGVKRLDFGVPGQTPEDLELVLKTSLIELKAEKFDWRRPAEELEALLRSGGAETRCSLTGYRC